MNRMITATLATAALASFVAPAIALEGRHADEFHEGLGNKLSNRTEQELYNGLGNKLSGRTEQEFYDGLGNKGSEAHPRISAHTSKANGLRAIALSRPSSVDSHH
ncbi:MAG: hypothetical protein AAF327_16525 [Cyanobacteria bacterium P01_A01_bin.37]